MTNEFILQGFLVCERVSLGCSFDDDGQISYRVSASCSFRPILLGYLVERFPRTARCMIRIIPDIVPINSSIKCLYITTIRRKLRT